jgi:hypothetical protein
MEGGSNEVLKGIASLSLFSLSLSLSSLSLSLSLSSLSVLFQKQAAIQEDKQPTAWMVRRQALSPQKAPWRQQNPPAPDGPSGD